MLAVDKVWGRIVTLATFCHFPPLATGLLPLFLCIILKSAHGDSSLPNIKPPAKWGVRSEDSSDHAFDRHLQPRLHSNRAARRRIKTTWKSTQIFGSEKTLTHKFLLICVTRTIVVASRLYNFHFSDFKKRNGFCIHLAVRCLRPGMTSVVMGRQLGSISNTFESCHQLSLIWSCFEADLIRLV